MGSDPSQIKLVVRSTSVLSYTGTKNILNTTDQSLYGKNTSGDLNKVLSMRSIL